MKENIRHLLEKYSRDACTQDELRTIEAWFLEIGAQKEGEVLSDERVEQMFASLKRSPRFSGTVSSDGEGKKQRFNNFSKVISFAAMLFLVCGVVFYFSNNQSGTEELNTSMTDIQPGGNQAFLTLSDGTKITLADTISGRIAEQQGIDVINDEGGTLVYSTNAQNLAARQSAQSISLNHYNTIETPRGGQYKIVLPDGSTAWLNAASSISFPVRFSTAERRVKVTGEVYFDIVSRYQDESKIKRVPFLVETSKHTIEVLGTQFNVHDYSDDQMDVTLVEGSVKLVSSGYPGRAVMLDPGQQAQISDQVHIVQADMEQALAWKNGDFIFKNEKLGNILEQVSRWYNVDVSYPDSLASLEFSGMISRKRPLSSIVNMIESTRTVKVIRKERRSIVIE